MTAQLLSELEKLRTSRTARWLLVGTALFVAALLALHTFSLSLGAMLDVDQQLGLFGMGTTFGGLAAGLLGALTVTSELRSGTIRPTLLVTPDRTRVFTAKVAASALVGAGFGILAEAVAIGAGAAGLAIRGLSVTPTAASFVRLVAGGAAGAALWGAAGVGVGALVRNQVAALVGLTAWVLFVEQTVIGVLPTAGKFVPGSSSGSLAGAVLMKTSHYLLSPAEGVAIFAAYLAVITVAAVSVMRRRDFN